MAKLKRKFTLLPNADLSKILSGAIILSVLAIWHISTEYFHLPFYILASPSETVTAFWEAKGLILKNLMITMVEAFAGFGLGTLFAFVSAAMFLRSRSLRNGCLPLAIIAQSIPIVVYVPFITILFGFGQASKIVIAVIISFFPALVNQVRGFESVDPLVYDLLKSLDATWWQTFWKLRVPSSLRFLFASLKITSALAIVGAMVGEWASGSFAGIGYLILVFNNQLRTDLLLAAVISSSIASVLFYAAIALVEKWTIKW